MSGPLGEAIRKALRYRFAIRPGGDRVDPRWRLINLVVLGARLSISKGHIVASAPKADIDLAARPFLTGKFVVGHITTCGRAACAGAYQRGRICRLGNEKNPSEDNIIARLSEIINAHGGSGNSLQSFAVRDARLANDEPTGLSLLAPHATLSIRASGLALNANFDADVQVLRTQCACHGRSGTATEQRSCLR